MISRRQLLALGTATAAASAAGVGGTLWAWWKQSPEDGHQHLSTTEAGFLRSLSEVAWPATERFPMSGSEAGLDHYVDGVLAGMTDATRSQLRLLFHALDHAPLATHLGSFQELEAEARSELLMGWIDSDLAEIRGAASSLVVFLGMGYTTHPEVAPWFSRMYGCGYAR